MVLGLEFRLQGWKVQGWGLGLGGLGFKGGRCRVRV